VLRHRLDHAGLGDRATLVDVDVVGTDPIELEVLGPFDRVLVYATFHYVRDAQQATIFLARVVDLLAPGGMALIGNLPLIDLADQLAGVRRARGRARLATMWSWVVHEPTPVPRPPAWKVRALMATAGRQIRRRVRPRPEDRAGPPPSVPVMPLRIDAIEAMLAGLRVPTSHGWLAPAVGIPMFLDRADLLITRRAPD